MVEQEAVNVGAEGATRGDWRGRVEPETPQEAGRELGGLTTKPRGADEVIDGREGRHAG